MKILVTGGLGFIGSNFIIKLLQKDNDFEIINIDAKLFGSNPYNLDEIKNSDRYEFVNKCVTKNNITRQRVLTGYKNIAKFKGRTLTKFSDRRLKFITLNVSVDY